MTNDFDSLYAQQLDYQKEVMKKICGDHIELPKDDVHWFSYHIQAMVEELGEVMKADKRWKTHRNQNYEPNEKLDEIADIFITVMNIAIYSGISSDKLFDAILQKISENKAKIK